MRKTDKVLHRWIGVKYKDIKKNTPHGSSYTAMGHYLMKDGTYATQEVQLVNEDLILYKLKKKLANLCTRKDDYDKLTNLIDDYGQEKLKLMILNYIN